MDSVPFIFISEVTLLLHGSRYLFLTSELQKLASPSWANEATRYVNSKWLYSISISQPYLYDEDSYTVLLCRRRSDCSIEEYIKIDDFDTFDVAKDA
uniref:Ovule protein n=1 Tax=Steinernema glaseri TaxID=37863 RepID=A0A1I7Z1B7_9BILA